MLIDVAKSFLSYQRRLVTAGLLSRFRLARGIANLTGAGLDLADRVNEVMIAAARRRWDLELVEHAPICRSGAIRRFADEMSPHFDCYELGTDEYLCFDYNLAHLDWLRTRITDPTQPRAVATNDALYRPVADVRALVRDEYIAPSPGIHIAAPAAGRREIWRGVLDLVSEVAHAVGVPGLLVERAEPAYYARRAVAAVLPSPQGGMEPWMLAYELGPAFEKRLGLPGTGVFEIGISSRVLAFAAQLQDSRAAVFGSAVTPTQVTVDLRKSTTDDAGWREGTAGLRTHALRSPDDAARPSTIAGLAPVRYEPDSRRYRLLLEDYRTAYPCDLPLPELVRLADRRLRAHQNELLAARLDRIRTEAEPVGDSRPGTVVAGVPGAWAGTRLDPRLLG